MPLKDLDLSLTVVPGKEESKLRPVLLLAAEANPVRFLPITTSFPNKSERVQEQFFPIEDWEEAKLDYPSWVDAQQVLFEKGLHLNKKLGTLTLRDRVNLYNFLENHPPA